MQLMQYEVTVNSSEEKGYTLVAEMNAEVVAEKDETLDGVENEEDLAAIPTHGDEDLAQESDS